MTSRSAGGSFEKQCVTSFYHKDWNIENNNILSRRFIVKTSLDQLNKIVKNKTYNTTVSYCQGCKDYVSLYCTECGRSTFTEDKKIQVGKDQEKAQSEKDSHSKNRGGKKPN